MSFRNSPLADSIAARAGEMMAENPGLSRDEIVDAILKEDGLEWGDDDAGADYAQIIGEVMTGERHPSPRI